MPLLSAEERLGTKLAKKYRLDRILGEGGMGVVFQAMDERFDRKVAVKFLHPQYAKEPEVVRRFINEAKSAAKLPGDHVVGVLDFDVDPADGSHYIVLEFLEGESLGDRLDRGVLTPQEAWQVLDPVMEVLEHAHSHGIVHRDLKPDNIYLSYNWKGAIVPKVLDFGIAKLMGAGTGKTATGMPIGTLTHMPPEQAQGKDVGPWSDVWAMGVVWFQCLTGRLAHDFPNDVEYLAVLLHVVSHDPQRLGTVAPHIDPAVCATIDRALQRDRQQRYGSMKEFRADLARTLESSDGRASVAAVGAIDRTVPNDRKAPGPGIDAFSSTAPGGAPGGPPGRADARVEGSSGREATGERPTPPAQPGPNQSFPSVPIGTVPGMRKLGAGRYLALAAAGAAVTLGIIGFGVMNSGEPPGPIPTPAASAPPMAASPASISATPMPLSAPEEPARSLPAPDPPPASPAPPAVDPPETHGRRRSPGSRTTTVSEVTVEPAEPDVRRTPVEPEVRRTPVEPDRSIGASRGNGIGRVPLPDDLDEE
jgi:hypothetical protein